MSWHPSGLYLAVGNKSDYLSIFDLRTCQLLHKKKLSYELNEFAWLADGQHIVAAVTEEHTGGTVLYQFQEELREVESSRVHCSSCYYLDVAKKAPVMALAGQDHCVSLWDMTTFEHTHTVSIE
jgi:THO complex subunit 3